MSPMPADLFFDQHVPAETEREFVAALADVDVDAQARLMPTRRGAEHLQWMVLLAVPLQAFLTTVGEKAAADAWTRVKGVLRRLAGRRPDDQGRPVLLQDPGTGMQIVLPPDLSDEGYQRLIELDLTAFTSGPIRYDRNAERWISDVDEARNNPR